jgi:type VI protein secretion system component VasF
MADTDLESKPVNQDALVADIDRTRDQLAHTIDAISDRVSPKKSAQRAVDRIRKRLSQVDPIVVGAAASAVVIGVTVLILWRRRR